MKKVMTMFLAGTMVLGFTACQNSTKKGADAVDTVSVSVDTATMAEDTAKVESLAGVLKANEGKYPRDIKLMENSLLTERVKKLTGNLYEDLIKNFNTQSPIVSEEGIYKFSGGKAHEVPMFNTIVYYDAANDNLNVVIERNGKTDTFAEKGNIKVTETLKSK